MKRWLSSDGAMALTEREREKREEAEAEFRGKKYLMGFLLIVVCERTF